MRKESSLYVALAFDAGTLSELVDPIAKLVKLFPEHDHRKSIIEHLTSAKRSLDSARGMALHAAGMRLPENETCPDREVECHCKACEAKCAAADADLILPKQETPPSDFNQMLDGLIEKICQCEDCAKKRTAAKADVAVNVAGFKIGEEVEFRYSADESFNFRGTIDFDAGGWVVGVNPDGSGSVQKLSRSNVRKRAILHPEHSEHGIDIREPAKTLDRN